MPLFDVEEAVDKKYTANISLPQYLPKNEKPKINHLFNCEKTDILVEEIRNSNVTDEEKNFLIKAAQRHLVFNYSKIADYYAHSNKEMQQLMEKSGLVIIDIDDAIANGYIKFSKKMTQLLNDAKEARNGK